MGKLLHYTALDAAASNQSTEPKDDIIPIIGFWPGNLDESRFCTSDGQDDIKRNESFVRIWRNTIAVAARTLTDWIDPCSILKGDILSAKEGCIEKAHDRKHVNQKIRTLFGTLDGVDLQNDESNLRNRSFHFNGRTDFIRMLEAFSQNEADKKNENTETFVEKLWKRDWGDRVGQLVEESGVRILNPS